MTPAEIHPLAEIFPLMGGREFDALVEDIKEHGLREPITLFEGKVLDGRNRIRACAAAGIEPACVPFDGDDPLGFVFSRNLHRRHLNEAQRAMIAARLADMPQGGRRDLGYRRDYISVGESAQLLRVSARSIARARKIDKTAVASLRAAVVGGRVSLLAAERASALPADEQTVLVAKGARAIVASARRTRGSRAARARQGYADLWRAVDAICDGLEASRLDKAAIAARELLRKIDAMSASRRGGGA